MSGIVPHISLYELLVGIKETLQNHYPAPIWFVAEVVSVYVHQGSGHCYLELMDKPFGQTQEARTKATIWKQDYIFIKRKFESQAGRSIQPGMRILMLGQIRFNEYYGFSIQIEDVNAEFSIGELAERRKKILQDLDAAGLSGLNKSLVFPFVPQRVAVISSSQAAGYGDFLHAIESNLYEYKFTVALFEAAMQGKQTAVSVIEALKRIHLSVIPFDVVVLIRGGGSQTDLFWFDDFELGSAIARFPLPVLSGVGHQRDLTVPDEVSYKSLITPTAVAAYLIEKVIEFEATIQGQGEEILDYTERLLLHNEQDLQDIESGILNRVHIYNEKSSNELNRVYTAIKGQVRFKLQHEELRIGYELQWVSWANPETQFRRGYALVAHENGAPLKGNPEIGDIIKLLRFDEELTAEILSKHEKRNAKKLSRSLGRTSRY